MRIDRLTITDLPAALCLSAQANWNQIEADWRRLIELWPDGCFAGRDEGGSLIATTTIAQYGTDLAWIGMVLVDELHRGRGIAGKMLGTALAHAHSKGFATIGLDATNLGSPVYLKHRFSNGAKIDRWARPPIKAQLGDSAGSYDVDEVLRMDYLAAGIDRTNLLRHLMDEAGVTCHVDPGGAYAICRDGKDADHIGPVVAHSESGAIELLDLILAERDTEGRQMIIDVPRGQLQRWLEENGFAVARELTRMQLGSSKPCLMGPKIYAGAGFELG